MRSLLSIVLALSALASTARAQDVGQALGDVELTGLTATSAESFADFQGRLVLLEFFAHW